MSIYSGFGTRTKQHQYNRVLETMVSSLSQQVKVILNKEQFKEKQFKEKFNRIYLDMQRLEQNKYLMPKYSQACREMVEYWKEDEDAIFNSVHKIEGSNSFKRIRLTPDHVKINLPTVKKSSTPELKKTNLYNLQVKKVQYQIS